MCENLEKHRNKNLKGFTLLEVMIALAILAVGILGIVSMHITAIEGNAGAVKFTDALLSAQGRIESILMHEFDGIDNSGASTGDGYTVETHATNPVIPAGYILEWRVLDTIDLSDPPDGIDDLKHIHVKVKDSDGKIRSSLNFLKDRG